MNVYNILDNFNNTNSKDMDMDDLQPTLLKMVENGLYRYDPKLIKIIKKSKTVDDIISELEYSSTNSYKMSISFKHLLLRFVPKTTNQDYLMADAIEEIERVINGEHCSP